MLSVAAFERFRTKGDDLSKNIAKNKKILATVAEVDN